MKVLGLDTSTLMASCGVINDDGLLGEYSLNQDMSHSENLMPMLEELLDNLEVDISDIDLYGVSVGPGSFTGLRIGLATVKAFAHLFDKPIVGVSTIEALAYNMAYDDIIIPMIDARRDRVYTGIYTWEDDKLKEILEPCVIPVVDLLEEAKKFDRITVNGNGTRVYKEEIIEVLGDKVRFANFRQNECSGSSIAELAKMKYENGEEDNYYTLTPEYLRETQAQRELNKNKSS